MLDADVQKVLVAIGANVTRLRKQKRMTQAQLAEAIDVETNFEQKIEYGTAVSSLSTIVRLAKALGVPVVALFRAAKPRKVGRGRPRGKTSRAGRVRSS